MLRQAYAGAGAGFTVVVPNLARAQKCQSEQAILPVFEVPAHPDAGPCLSAQIHAKHCASRLEDGFT